MPTIRSLASSHFSSLFRSILCMLMVCLITSPIYASWWWPFGDKTLDYSIKIDGVDAQTMRWFKTLKLDEKTQKNPPKKLSQLTQEGMRLENRLNEALQAKGYYQAQIEQKIDTKSKPPVLYYHITPGPQARVSNVRLQWQDDALPAPSLDTLLQQAGNTIDAEAINQDADKLQTAIGKDACLLSLEVTPVLQLNPATHQAELVYQIVHGPRAYFGEVHLKGNKRTNPHAIHRLLVWKEGECFTQEKVTQSQTALFGSQLFSSVKITPGTQPDETGKVPMNIKVTERLPRTLSAQANYASDQGFGIKLGWEHRNLYGNAEKANADVVWTQQERSLLLTERVPGFWRDNQTLALSAGVKDERTDVYTSKGIGLSAAIERKINSALNGGLGLGYDLKRADDLLNGPETYSLVSIPVFIEMDTRDKILDATKGFFARLQTTPYQDMVDSNLRFLRTNLIGQTYFSVADIKYRPTLALRASLGSNIGAPDHRVPADLRYYAGGGGSVRGYSYQSLSPRVNGQPVGGDSLLELSSELRLRFTDTIGGVAFIDAGNAYATNMPDTSKLYYGAGVGVRYYSPVGPIRFDVGVPLNGKDIDQKSFAVYVSLGQAF